VSAAAALLGHVAPAAVSAHAVAVSAHGAAVLADPAATVASGSLILAVPIALVAGLVSFLSPCVLPLVPGYLSYVTGLTGVDLGAGATLDEAARAKRGRMVLGSLLFILGFTTVFVLLGALSGWAGGFLNGNRHLIQRVFGALTIVMGLSFAGVLPGVLSRVFNREVRFHRDPKVGLLGAPMLGLLFGLGWTPCIGPTLAAIEGMNLSQGTMGRAIVTSVAYCLGLGLPFVLAAVAFRKAMGAFGWVKRHYQAVMRIGGGMLVVVGVLLVTGTWDHLVVWLQGLTPGYTAPI
jgi:cytochrome c-type biogenesis protein